MIRIRKADLYICSVDDNTVVVFRSLYEKDGYLEVVLGSRKAYDIFFGRFRKPGNLMFDIRYLMKECEPVVDPELIFRYLNIEGGV